MKNAKRNFLMVLMILASTFNSFSQWVLTRQNFPMSGDYVRQYTCDTNGIGINPGISGVNVTWDYSMIQYNPNPSTTVYSSTISFPYCVIGGFPTANMRSSYIPSYQIDNYYFIDSAANVFLGFCQDIGAGAAREIKYTDPFKTMKFPWTYGDTLSDSAEGPHYLGFSNNRYFKSFVYQECDGWGTLILPWATYDSTLRVHGYSLHQDSIINVGKDRLDSTDYYTWYTKSLRSPVLQIYNEVSTDSNNVIIATYAGMYVYTVNSLLSVDEQSKNINEVNVYPNPISDKLNVSVNNNEHSEIIIYDITSRKLLQQKFINSITINTEQFVKGIYLYEVRSKNNLYKQGKLVKN